MTDPVNLNKFRKAKARAEKQQRASENRVKHGRTKAERERAKALSEKSARITDAHKLESPDEN